MAKRFQYTHLENAPKYLRDIEELDTGGWRAHSGRPRLVGGNRNNAVDPRTPEPRITTIVSASGQRRLRLVEPRGAPLPPPSSVRSHHFEMKTILAENRHGRSIAELRSAYQEAEGRHEAGVQVVRASSASNYMEMEKDSEGDRVFHITATNGKTHKQRQDFWQLANKHANVVGEHRITVDLRGNEEAWTKFSLNRSMPVDLRRAIKEARENAGRATIVVNDAGVTRRWMKRRAKSIPSEVTKSIVLATPRNDRVAYSFIGQLPFGLSEAGQKCCADQWMAIWTAMGVPGQAVIHHPTRKNDRRNIHFHGQIYRGCAEQLEGGRWSFERIEKRDKFRSKKLVPLRRMPVPDLFGDQDLIPKLKCAWQDIVNAQAEREGLAIRFTDEKNEQRGLPAPKQRLSPGHAAQERKGFLTDKAIDANLVDWDRWEKNEHQKQKRARRDRFTKMSEIGLPTNMLPPQMALVNELVTSRRKALVRLAAADRIAIKAIKLLGMLRSGPEAIIDYYASIVGKSDKSKPTQSGTTAQVTAEANVGLANDYITAIEPELSYLELIRDTARSTARTEQAKLYELGTEFETMRGEPWAAVGKTCLITPPPTKNTDERERATRSPSHHRASRAVSESTDRSR
jgi:hypothetical protein